MAAEVAATAMVAVAVAVIGSALMPSFFGAAPPFAASKLG